jgi:membrane-associated protease RseP (regulator of RpoE activity)
MENRSTPTTTSASRRRRTALSIVLAVVYLLPLALLLFAFSAGVAIPFWLYAVVVLLSIVLPLVVRRGRREPDGATLARAEETGVVEAAHSVEAASAHRPLLSLGLALATLVTTTYVGAAHQGVNLLRDPAAWTVGLPYALGVMLILGVHEMGHYLAARRHGIHVSLPYFIPLPFGLGTFGAFITMPAYLQNRRQLFDVAVAGPLVGLAVAIPALAIGLQWSRVLPFDPGSAGHMGQGVSVNASMMLALVSRLAAPEAIAQGHYLVLHPLAFAGWLGLMITALNLLPVGQLDGGHMAQALFGRGPALLIGRIALGGMVVLGLFVWPGLITWALIVYLVAGRPAAAPANLAVALDGRRRALGWFAYGLLALILLPLPHALSSTLGLHCPYL